ncbi:MAG: thioredoxin family protein [Cyanobacteria bacterium SZAS TMP-1]|nr:thioredoxin family protein [Cyanobacteria bacterium SZAS TMP-1]
MYLILALFLCLFAAPGQFANQYQFDFGAPAWAQSPAGEKAPEPVKATLLSDQTGIVAGGKFKLGVKLVIEPGWHTYYKDPGDSGMPTKLTWDLPEGFTSGPIIWPKPHKSVDAGIVAYGYSDSVLHVTEITAPANLKVGDKVTLKVNVKYLVCKDVCMPGKAALEITLPVVAAAEKSPDAALFDEVGTGFNDPVSTLTLGGEAGPTTGPATASATSSTAGAATPATPSTDVMGALLFAFFGGVILNVMPCVLPVIAIKVLSLLEQAKEEPAKIKLLGLIFSAGIISSFMVLATVVILVKAGGQAVGWGFQFQYPGFVLIMCSIILIMALSLFGMFYVNVQASGTIDQLARQEGLVGTFFKGVLATILSTPCTAPFLGVALGFAFSQSAGVIALIFFTIALGMASPYLLLTINPAWIKFIPKPGDWMDKFKQSMGFLMLFTVVWLDTYVLASQVSADVLVLLNIWLVGLAFCAWIVANFSDLTSSKSRRLKVLASAGACFMLFSYICIFAQPAVMAALTPGSKVVDDGWKPYSPEALTAALAQKRPVFLDFTAAWCLTCKVNEKTVISTAAVRDKIKALNVVTLKADWTKQDPDITKLLNQFNRSGVPLYVIYPVSHQDKPIVLPEVITQELVLKSLDEASR